MSHLLPELKLLMKEHKIRGGWYMNKHEIIAKLVEKGVLPEPPIKERKPRCTDPKYEHLKGIRVNPRKVTIRDLETGEVKTYNSIYKASRDLGHFIVTKNGKVLDGRYEVMIGEPTGEAAAQQE